MKAILTLIFVTLLLLSGMTMALWLFGFYDPISLAMLGGLAIWILVTPSILTQIPTFHYGVQLFGEERLRGHLDEGYRLKKPWASVGLINRVLEAINFSVSFFTKDGAKGTATISLQWSPDPWISDENGRNVYYVMSSIIVNEGVTKKVANLFEIIAGQCDRQDFVTARDVIALLINADLRLDWMPHEHHDPTTCGQSGCGYPAGFIPAEQWIAFYRMHADVLTHLLNTERDRPWHWSTTEVTYGIDVRTVEISDPAFSEETEKAMAEAQEAKARETSMKAVRDEMAALLTANPGLDPNAALDAALLGRLGSDSAPRQAYSLPGLGGILKRLGG